MMQDDDDNDDPMILNIRAKNHTSERTIVPWTVIFFIFLVWFFFSEMFNSLGQVYDLQNAYAINSATISK